LRPLGAEPPAAQLAAHGGAGQPLAIAAGDQLSDRLAGPQKPGQAELVGGALANQRDDLLLLRFAKGGLFAWTATAAPFDKPLPAALPVAFDPTG